jgi:hypothetical protein
MDALKRKRRRLKITNKPVTAKDGSYVCQKNAKREVKKNSYKGSSRGLKG